jgi:hypothetical protein
MRRQRSDYFAVGQDAFEAAACRLRHQRGMVQALEKRPRRTEAAHAAKTIPGALDGLRAPIAR